MFQMAPKPGGNGWSDIGYHYLVGPDGVIYEGRPPDTQGAHVADYNTNRVGVCMIGNFESGNDDPTTEQREALEAILTYLAVRFDIDVEEILSINNNQPALLGHRNLGSTECPGDDLYASLGSVRTAVTARIANADVTPPDPCGEVSCFNGGSCDDGECSCPDGFTGSDCGTIEGNTPDDDDPEGSRAWLVLLGLAAVLAGLLLVLGVAAVLNPGADLTPVGRQRGPSRFDFGVASSFKVGDFGVANRDAKGSLPPLPPGTLTSAQSKLPYTVGDEDPKAAAASHAPERSDVHQLAVEHYKGTTDVDPMDDSTAPAPGQATLTSASVASVATVPMSGKKSVPASAKQSVLSAKSVKSKKSFVSKTTPMSPAEDPVAAVAEEPPKSAVGKGSKRTPAKGSHRSKGSKGSKTKRSKGSHRSKKGGSKGSKGSRRSKSHRKKPESSKKK